MAEEKKEATAKTEAKAELKATKVEKKEPTAELPDTPSGAALAEVGEPDPEADPHDPAEQERSSRYQELKRKLRWG